MNPNLITTLVLALIYCSTSSRAQDIPDFPFIVAEGTASREVPTETAFLQITISASAVPSAKAEEQFSEKATKLRELINEFGLKATFQIVTKDKHWKFVSPDGTVQDDTNPFFDNDDPFGGGDPFGSSNSPQKKANSEKQKKALVTTIQQKIECQIIDLEKYPTILPRFLKADFVSQCHTQFGIKDYQSLKQELNKEAVEAAKKQAKFICEAAGTELDKIHSISLQGFGELEKFRVPKSGSMFSVGGRASNRVIYEVPATLPYSFSASILYRLKD